MTGIIRVDLVLRRGISDAQGNNCGSEYGIFSVELPQKYDHYISGWEIIGAVWPEVKK